MRSKFSFRFLRFTRVVVFLFLVGTAVNLFMSGYDTGYVAAHSRLKPADTIMLQLDRNHPTRYPFDGAVRAFQNGWNYERWQNRAISRPVFFSPDSVQASFNSQGFDVVVQRNRQVLRYQEPSFGKRLALLWLGASSTTMSVVEALIMFGLALLLWQLLRDVTPATPFTLANARRLRTMMLLVVSWEIWQMLAHMLLLRLVPNFVADGGTLVQYVVLHGDGHTPGALGIIMLTVIALVYRRGVELQQEAELTV
ncbi:DUF2975 domain-containing protein [Hymenobacter endophyticus]|uniref:DUF2975 domain-containing protein n=1 Tax=Hymenobacter endophyticus TaxID=3076335 RepID=A0ABU3TDP7_9BACT|nr:DUF2975 domain-containing protein [Hymenobacter endophyticus]MDU0369470.1 DUF2975 domain-containing protein [Hymenobacter endophyticus]